MPRPCGRSPAGAGFLGMKQLNPAAGRKGSHAMRNFCSLRGVAAALIGGVFTVAMSGCGLLSIESWVVINTAKSSGSVSIAGGPPQNL